MRAARGESSDEVEIATVGAVQDQAVLPEFLTGPSDVVLRRWVPTDAELLGRGVAQSLEHVRPWLSWVSQEPLSVERRKQMILDWEREWLRGGDVLMGIFVAGQMAGGCGLHRRLDRSYLGV